MGTLSTWQRTQLQETAIWPSGPPLCWVSIYFPEPARARRSPSLNLWRSHQFSPYSSQPCFWSSGMVLCLLVPWGKRPKIIRLALIPCLRAGLTECSQPISWSHSMPGGVPCMLAKGPDQLIKHLTSHMFHPVTPRIRSSSLGNLHQQLDQLTSRPAMTIVPL